MRAFSSRSLTPSLEHAPLAPRGGRWAAALCAALSLLLTLSAAVEAQSKAGYADIRQMLSGSPAEARKASKKISKSGDLGLVPGLVDALFFSPSDRRERLFESLERLTGEKLERRYYAWVEWLGAQQDIRPRLGYPAWKGSLFQRIDTRFTRVFDPGVRSTIRLEEIVSGGVPLDGIPSIDDPDTVSAADAAYLQDDEDIFGVVMDGEARAYPRRMLSWHEMLNDRIAGRPVTLSYCTLCGSAILYSGATNVGDLTFGTSGLLYRSNKLMFDRKTLTLWSNLTGEPVLGPLLGSAEPLEMLPMTLTTWGEWRRLHPETRAIAYDRQLEARYGFDYTPGAADRARTGVAFPVWQKSERLAPQDEVYALRLDEQAKAWTLTGLLEAKVVNDAVGETPLVLIASPASGAVRAYRRGERSFSAAGEEGVVVDDEGKLWRVGENALSPAEGGAALPRVPGHVALWFGWYGFHPQTEIWTGAS